MIFVAFHAASLTTLDPNALVNLAGAVFIAPFVLFSATSGQLADKLEKGRLMRAVKNFEIAIMALPLTLIIIMMSQVIANQLGVRLATREAGVNPQAFLDVAAFTGALRRRGRVGGTWRVGAAWRNPVPNDSV